MKPTKTSRELAEEGRRISEEVEFWSSLATPEEISKAVKEWKELGKH